MSSVDHLPSMLIASGLATVLLSSYLAFVLLKQRKKAEETVDDCIIEMEDALDLNVSGLSDDSTSSREEWFLIECAPHT